jgi:hypothetical protein
MEQFMSELDLPTLRKRTRASISGIIVEIEDRESGFGMTIGLGESKQIADDFFLRQFVDESDLLDTPMFIDFLYYMEDELDIFSGAKKRRAPRQGLGSGSRHVCRLIVRDR